MNDDPDAGPTSLPPDAADHSPRMAALAQISAGIAPALSDLLTVIRGQAGLLLDRAEGDAASRESLNQIYAAADRAGNLLRQLQIFSRQHLAHAEAVELNPFLHEMAEVIRRLLDGKISVEFQLAPDLPRIMADADMLEQLIIILALNAGDAMPTGGRLVFKTEAKEISAESARAWRDGRAGKFVVLSSADTGRGIAPEILPRLFEPFFTTKTPGRSVGLGLAAAFGIVQQHHGWMAVQSAVGVGSSFRVYWPAAPEEAGTKSSRGPDGHERSGQETILFVEDDVSVREVTAMILKESGYRVLQAGSGPEALEVWKWHGARVRLLLTDMVLEDDMSGLELATKLRAENPALRVICTSGYERDNLKRFPALAGGYQYLQKPCRPRALLAAVRTLLDDTPK